MTALPPRLRRRLGQLVPRLSSPFDSERLATVRAIRACLLADGRDFNDLAALIASGDAAPCSRPLEIEPPPNFNAMSHFERRAWLTAIADANWLGSLEKDHIATAKGLVVAGLDYALPPRIAKSVNAALARAHASGVRVRP